MQYPLYRPRRMRRSENARRMARETVLTRDDLIYPLFITWGLGVKRAVPSMPGVFNFSIDKAMEELDLVCRAGIPAVMLFGLPEKKDEAGTGAYDDEGVIQSAVRSFKAAYPDLLLITDVCLCEYTSHGHCGIVQNQVVDNDSTLELLGAAALSHARAGADMVAPSDMMDGRVAFIRKKLDMGGFDQVSLMAYSVKYASAFYGPFREAACSAPQFGDRRGYQMDPPNAREALREVALDIGEGADIIMVKPALAYLDIVRMVRDTFNHPVAAYNVSGEYAMVKAAAARGWIDERRLVLEALTSIKRAGADMIITYHALDAAGWLE